MKIALLTLHYGFNEGAILQAYCLHKALEMVFPEAVVEIIDHRYPAKLAAYQKGKSAKDLVLERAVEEWLPLSSQQWITNDYEATHEHLDANYDLVVVGSDIVWTLPYKKRVRGLVTLPNNSFHPAFPNLYWPPRSSIPWVTYAASAGDTIYEDIPFYHRGQIRRALHRYALISVRDVRTQRMAKMLNRGRELDARLVPDPTILHSLKSQYPNVALRQKLTGWGVEFDRPRCAIIGEGHAVYTELVSELRAMGFQMIGYKRGNDACDVNLANYGLKPLEWAASLGMMDLCITERMHASIFCILNHTPIVALDINRDAKDDPSKLRELMSKVGLQEYYHRRKDVGVAGLLSQIATLRKTMIDWEEVDHRLDDYRQAGVAYLHDVRSHCMLREATSRS